MADAFPAFPSFQQYPMNPSDPAVPPALPPGRPVRVLVVEDAEDDALLAMRMLRRGGFAPQYRRVQDLRTLRQALAGEPWDAVLSDFSMPGFTGLDALAAFRDSGLDIPFVFISGTIGEEMAVAAMKAGASDYVMKQNLARLAPVLERELGQSLLRAAHRSAQADADLSRDRYVDLFEFAPVGYLLLSADDTIEQVNETGAEMLAEPRATLAGTPFQRFLLAGDVERWHQHLRRTFAGTERQRIELRLRGPHGSVLHVQADSRCVEADRGQRRVRVALTDISDRKEAEASLRRFEAKLREVQKMESLGTLAGGIAHDFNNILAAILGNVELADDDVARLAGAAPVRHSLDEIRKAGLRARDLVHQILTFSRREPQELVTQPLLPVVEETHKLLRATLPARVELEVHVPPEPLYVHADATQLQQVLMNLCTNAWHALKDGAGRITVSLSPAQLEAGDARRLGLDGPGGYVHLRVSDTGTGMDALTLARIFEPFFTTKPVGQGTGLGLSVVHGILAAHRGAVDVESAPGQGSTFHLWFPRADTPPPAPPRAAEPAPARHGEGEHVVYIDDDETMVMMVERLLVRAGYRVACFTDPAVALDRLRDPSMAIDCVVTDFNMPEVTGLEVARELRQRRPGVPVIISTGYLSEELRSDARALGVRSLLEKERTVQQLADLVGSVLAGSVAR